MRDFIRQFLLYTRSERKAVIALMILITAVVIIPRVYIFYSTHTNAAAIDPTFQREISQWQSKDSGVAVNPELPQEAIATKTQSTLYYFDPNTIGISDWLRLGISQHQAEGIERYKAKGGYFRSADDLRRLYSLTDADKERLIPYVRISATAGTTHASTAIDINTADSAAFESLRGIGPVLAARIVRYRTELGGFVSVDQVGEVRGIRDSVFVHIRPYLRVHAHP